MVCGRIKNTSIISQDRIMAKIGGFMGYKKDRENTKGNGIIGYSRVRGWFGWVSFGLAGYSLMKNKKKKKKIIIGKEVEK